MNVKILESKNYEEIANILYNSYVSHWGEVGTPKWNPKYVEFIDKAYVNDGVYVGAFENNELIGVGAGYITKWHIDEVKEITAFGICNFGVLPKFQRKNYGTQMVNSLIEEAKLKNADIIFRICNEKLFDWKTLEKTGFTKKMNNISQFARIMGKDMIETVVKIKNYGAIMRQLVKMVAGLPGPDKCIQEGKLRDGNINDTNVCVKILNDYKEKCKISKIWSENEFKKIIENFDVLTDPFKPFFIIWEIDGTVKAFIIGRTEDIKYQTDDAKGNVIVDTGFSQDLMIKQKIEFLNSVILFLKEKYPESMATNCGHVHHELKAFDKANFNDDRSTRPLYVKLLNNDLKEWFEDKWKLKTYYIPYQR
ncbi:MAG: GNAT family N-acetyltransferase [Candidatus Helarchaeota archaeon]